MGNGGKIPCLEYPRGYENCAPPERGISQHLPEMVSPCGFVRFSWELYIYIYGAPKSHGSLSSFSSVTLPFGGKQVYRIPHFQAHPYHDMLHLQSSSPFGARCSVRKGQPSSADLCVQRATTVQRKAALNVRPHRSGQRLPGLAMDRKWRFPEITEPKTQSWSP